MISFGVILDMKNPNALCTVGMLSALWERDRRDYIDLVSPFVLASLPTTIGQEIDIEQIQATIKSEYGFDDMPLGFIKGILQRNTKIKASAHPYIRKEKGKYYVATAFDNKDFLKDQLEMRRKIDYVLDKMKNYFVEHKPYKSFDSNTLKDMLTNFFESCGFTMAKDVNDLQMITKAKNGKENFWVAQCILDLSEWHALEFEYLKEIVRGFFAYKALYYLERENKASISSKLKDVTFYLDCSLVINYLGYDSKVRQQGVRELIDLIRRNGGQVCVFEHTVAEAESLLSAFAKRAGRKNAFQLEGLASKNYPLEMLEAISSSVSANLMTRGMIETVPAPGYSVENYPDVQDEKAITNWLRESRGKSGRHRENGDRFDYDTKSLAAIGMLRKNNHPTKIERCKAILVTQDPWLTQCMKALSPKVFHSEIDFAMLDIDVVSLLWLSSYDAKSSLPMDVLIANATAACQLTQEIMDRAIELTDRLIESGDLTEDAALLIRSQSCMRQYLFDVTENDVNAVSPENVQRAINKYVKEKASKHIEEATSLLERKKQRELDQKDQEIQQLRAIVKRMENTEKARANKRGEAAHRAKDKSEKVAKRFKCGIMIASVLILLVTVGIWVFKVFTDYTGPLHLGWRILFVVLDILALFQIIDYFRNPNGWIEHFSRRICNSVYTYVYNKEITKIDL